MKSVLLFLLAVVLLAGCADPGTDHLAEGEWHAWLDSPGGELPFGLEVSRDDEQLEVVIINGSERIRVQRVETNGAELLLGIDHYDSTIVATVADGGTDTEENFQALCASCHNSLTTPTRHAKAKETPATTPGGGG